MLSFCRKVHIVLKERKTGLIFLNASQVRIVG